VSGAEGGSRGLGHRRGRTARAEGEGELPEGSAWISSCPSLRPRQKLSMLFSALALLGQGLWCEGKAEGEGCKGRVKGQKAGAKPRVRTDSETNQTQYTLRATSEAALLRRPKSTLLQELAA
jgi:hypothetical protein